MTKSVIAYELNQVPPWALSGGVHDGVVEPSGNGGEAGEADCHPDVGGRICH